MSTEAQRARQKRYRASPKGRATLRAQWARRWLRSQYGLTKDDVAATLTAQGGCGICETTTPGNRTWQVDHNHKTGAVRGVLCFRCNLGGGCFNDNPHLLTRAAGWFQ